MKRSTMTPLKRLLNRSRLIAAALLMIVSVPLAIAPSAQADRYDDQIDAAQSEADRFQAQANQYRTKANTLQNALNLITAEKNIIQKKIDTNEAKKQKLIFEIGVTEKDILKNQEVIGSTLGQLYVDSSLSPLELLASSSSIGDYVDKQEYRTAVREQIQNSIKEIKALRQKLNDQKTKVEQVLKNQKAQRDQVRAKEVERQRLLAQTRGQEATYRQLVSKRKSEIDALRAQQAAAMAAAARGRGPNYAGYTNYPFNDSSMAYNDNCQYYSGGSAADPWGYCKRQCTSYVAWKLAKDRKDGFSGMGHAINWAGYGEHVDFRNAQTGDVLVWFIGDYGHVMYVDAVTSDGLAISQYNVPYDSGRYSTDFYSWSSLDSGFELRRF